LKSISYILLITLICFSVFTSCVDKIALPETTSPAKIHVECELSPPFHIKARLSTTGDLNANYFPTFPEDATIRLYSEIDEEFLFKYNDDLRIYEVTNGRLRSGLKYTLSASVKDSSITPVFASTNIPPKGEVDTIEVTHIESFNTNSGTNQDLLKVKVTLENSRDKFYRVFFHSRYALLDNTTTPSQWNYNSNLRQADVSSVIKGGTGVHDAYHLDGVLVNPEILDDNSFEVELAVDRSILKSEEELKSLHIRLSSVSESYYRYHLALSKKYKSAGKNAIEPVIDFTNISNGYGFIGGFVTTSDSVLIR
jgi:hypothetical protein